MLYSLKQQIISADTFGIVVFLVFMAILCAASLYGIFRFFHRSRFIDDTPTSKIRSAHQGFVELEGEGRLMKGTPIVSPLSGRKCLWYDFKIEQRVKELDIGPSDHYALTKSSWQVVNSGTSDNLFLLADKTGICVVDPEGAVITPSFSKSWYGSREFQASDTASANAVFSLSMLTGNKNYRYTEKRIDIGEDLYMLGRFKTIGGRREKLDKKGEIRDLLASWKNRPNFLLAKFDKNQDGEIDLDEWQKVMAAAEQEVEKSFGERLVQSEIHTLSKPVDSRRPFIISVESQETIARKYRRFSSGSILGFFLSGISFIWVIGIRLAN